MTPSAAQALSDVPDIARLVASDSRPNDLILVMSNGSFAGFIPLLLESLQRAKR